MNKPQLLSIKNKQLEKVSYSSISIILFFDLKPATIFTFELKYFDNSFIIATLAFPFFAGAFRLT